MRPLAGPRFSACILALLAARLAFAAEPAAGPVPKAQPPAGAPVIASHGSAGMIAPGTFTLALVFLTAFVLYYFVNWKYLSTVWPLK